MSAKHKATEPKHKALGGGLTDFEDKEKTMAFSEYKVLHIAEGGCGTIFLGASGVPLKRLEAELNEHAADGWQLVFQTLENKRYLLFWNREAVIVTLAR